ncbi:MAG TPA: hypothetical protein VIG53_01555 [Actinomycetota bacterium]
MRRPLLLAGTVLVWVLALAGGASAHPLGNFTVNRALAVTLRPGSIEVAYTIDHAEIPTVQLLPSIDTDGDGRTSPDELQTWADAQAMVVAADLRVAVDGEPLRLATGDASAAVLEGQAGLAVLRFDARFDGRLPTRGVLTVEDRSDDGRIGWREVTAAGVDGVALAGSDVPATSPSGGLRTYPQDASESPLDVRSMRAAFEPGTGTAADAIPSLPGSPLAVPGGALLATLLRDGGGLVLLGAIAVAFGFGAWHALMPGHGKTLMAAAMVGGGGRARQAAAAALAVAAMHTVSVLGLGIAVLALEASFRPETLYPWLAVVSGTVAAFVGATLLRGRWRAWRHVRAHRDAAPGERSTPHHHPHDHPHPGGPLADERLGLRGLGALALAGGIVPAPSALLALLVAIQLHRTAAGIAVVAAFSVGLAAALLGIGVGALKARDLLRRRVSPPAAMALPVVSAAVMVVVGGLIAAGAIARL